MKTVNILVYIEPNVQSDAREVVTQEMAVMTTINIHQTGQLEENTHMQCPNGQPYILSRPIYMHLVSF